MERVPREIREIYKISSILTMLVFIIGIISGRSELYLAFPVGSILSFVNTYLLSKEVYTMVYIKENLKSRSPYGFFVRMAIYIIGMLLVVYVSRRYFPDKVTNNIIFTGLGFMIFKISLYINQKIKKFAKKN